MCCLFGEEKEFVHFRFAGSLQWEWPQHHSTVLSPEERHIVGTISNGIF